MTAFHFIQGICCYSCYWVTAPGHAQLGC